MQDKLVIISTRLPVVVSKVDGKLKFSSSAGGLATGVSSIKKSRDSVWVGWPGIASDDLTPNEKKQIISELKKLGCYPVFLSEQQVENFYSGYSNSTLWPLFHYFTTQAVYRSDYFEHYKSVNQMFAETAAKFAGNDAKLWVHDYQLMLVPNMLRSQLPQAAIGFFLHTPFPSFEIFRLLPERTELLNGLLGANLVGFHSYDYVRHFLNSALIILGYENSLGTITLEDRHVRTDAFPIGIDYNKFARGAKRRAVKKLLKSFNFFDTNTKVILAVDRADYTKGIPDRLDAFELFLEKYPQHLKKAVLVIIAIPSRGGVHAYQNLRETIEQKVSRINGRFATVDWSPITYRYQSVPFDELVALYARADVMLVTPLRDGMNLVAKEYVASKHHDTGVLILSEMAGAANELSDALLVNPHDQQQLARAIHQGLTMPLAEQRLRLKKMQERVSEYNIKKWANDYVSELKDSVSAKKDSNKQITAASRTAMIKSYAEAEDRLILLDYDGTLKKFSQSHRELHSRPTAKLKKLLRTLTKDSRNTVYIISGRPRNTLENYFKNNELGLIAEHGGWVFDAGGWIKSSIKAQKWKKSVRPVIEQFVARTPGSEIEEKDFSVVWHYRNVSPDLAYVRKEEIQKKLRTLLPADTIGVFEGNKIIEIKPKRMNKGVIAADLTKRYDWDFILAIGDDYTDEDMFRALPDDAYSIKVGSDETDARFRVDTVSSVLNLIDDLI